MAVNDPSAPSALPPAHNALAAFLRGIELRAWVFALRQAGDEARAESGLARALHGFLAEARSVPLAQWPLRFWACLLREPALVRAAEAGATGLPGLPPGPRAALLLRLVAGLDIDHAAQALGVTPEAYEKALHRALAAPGLEAQGIEALRQELQAQMHDAPAAQRQLLATWRDEALLAADDQANAQAANTRAANTQTANAQTANAGAANHPVANPQAAAHRPRPPRRARMALAAALLVVTAGAVAVWVWRHPSGPPTPVVDRVAPPPAMTDAVVVTHPDYLLVAAPLDQAVARELPFLSWMAAATLPAPTDPLPAPPAEPATRFEALAADEQAVLASAREAWSDLDAPTRASLLRQARDWIARTAEQRERLRADLVAWDKLPAPEHARRRTPFAAWERLDETDRAWVRLAAARVASLPADEQQRLRAQFAASPPDTQALWWLGPGLGQELAPFSSLFAYLPESERPALLQVLRGLEPDARADLGLLAPRLTEARRQALRRDLLAAPAQERSQLIRERLSR